MIKDNYQMEQAIINGSRREKQQAISLLYDQCFPVIYKLVAKEADRSIAEDIFQEGITKLYDNLIHGRFEGRSKISTYLIGICKNIWLMRLRKNKIFYADLPEEPATSDADVTIDEEKLILLLSNIDSGCFELLTAIYYERKSAEEIEAQFNLGSNQALRNKKSKCLKKLMKLVKDSGLTYESFLR